MIHTSAADFGILPFFRGKFGLLSQVGHVDYYPNGGSDQPHCGSRGSCNHWAAIYYFIESLKTGKHFYSVGCKSWNDFKDNKMDETNVGDMGFNSDLTKAYGMQCLEATLPK